METKRYKREIESKKPLKSTHNYTMIQGYRGAYSSGWYYVLDGTYIAYIYGGFERIVDVLKT